MNVVQPTQVFVEECRLLQELLERGREFRLRDPSRAARLASQLRKVKLPESCLASLCQVGDYVHVFICVYVCFDVCMF